MAPIQESDGFQLLSVMSKDKDGKVSISAEMPVMYVPLTDKEKQWPQ